MSSLTISHIALVGTHSTELRSALEGMQNVSVSNHDTFQKYNESQVSAHAVVIAGPEATLTTDPKHIKELLDSRIVLAFFNPTKDLLATIHTTTKSILDLSSTEPKNGIPLVIHKDRDSDFMHITPGFVFNKVDGTKWSLKAKPTNTSKGMDTSKIQGPPAPRTRPSKPKSPSAKSEEPVPPVQSSSTPLASILAQESSEIILESIARARPLVGAQMAVASTYVNNLTPPQDTSFFKKTTVHNRLTWALAEAWDSDGYSTTSTDGQKWSVNWTITLYAYATGANPTEDNFSADGGVVYLVAVHSGQVQRPSSATGRWFGPDGGNGTSESEYWFMDHVRCSMYDGGSLLQTETLLPEIDTGTQSGTSYSYDINFSESFQMYKDGGDTLTTFQATYQQSFTLAQFIQSAIIEDAQKMYFDIDYKNYYDRCADPDFDTDGWLGVYDNSQDEHYVKMLPKDYLNLHGLGMYSSDVGKTTVYFYCYPEWLAFYSDTAWDNGYYGGGVVGSWAGQSQALDLTFSS